MNIVRVFREAFPLLLKGLGMTAQITLVSLLVAFVLGLAACLMGMSKIKIVSWISKAYIWVIRGTPLLVQAFFIYFGLPQFIQAMGFNFRLHVFVASAITLSLNAGAYIAELFRGGIQAVDKGQMEAARSLGLTKGGAMARVILPQALRISVPALLNQVIITLKDTSIVSVIGLGEIVYQAKIYMGRTMESFATWAVVGIMYLVLISVLTVVINLVEKRMSYASKS